MPQPLAIDPDLATSPSYLLAVLFSARRSKDRFLERLTRRRLERLGIHVAFDDEPPVLAMPKGGRHA
jgi:hypothetical protein